jgi:hypothetical protein
MSLEEEEENVKKKVEGWRKEIKGKGGGRRSYSNGGSSSCISRLRMN